MMTQRDARIGLIAAGLLAILAAPAHAQDPDFKKLIERGDYKALAKKLRPHLELDKADPKLRSYLEMNLAFLARGGRAAQPGQELILFRGAKNDQVFRMPASSGGDGLMLPNSIRYMRTGWDARLPRISRYFAEATTATGGNGNNLHELDRIIEHHKGGGLGTSANSTKSVLISASTRPISHFGPPYYILKVAPERAIFNHKGLTSEYEVLLPFWVLPTEIVAKVETYQELMEHPLYKQSKLKGLEVRSWGYGSGSGANNWELIENNIRSGRPPLEGIAGLNSYFAEGPRVGPVAGRPELDRFSAEVARRGGLVEYVEAGDPRLPEGAQARTYLVDGKPKVLLRRGEPAMRFALVDELTHVSQLESMLKRHGAAEVETLLMRSALGDPAARDVVNRWEILAKKNIRGTLPANDPAREVLARSIRALEGEVDQLTSVRRRDGTVDWSRVGREAGAGLLHFGMALFLKELAMVAQTGDRLRIEEFFEGLLKTDFYVQYGLFSLGAAGADAAYRVFLERNLARFLRPRFVQSVLRSNLTLAAGMALPELLSGHFDGRTFAINLAGLGLSSTAVKAAAEGLSWVFRLERVPGGLKLANTLARHARLASVGGFLYRVAETAVVLYFGDMISRKIDKELALRSAAADVRAATARLLRDPKGPEAREALDALAEANRAWRDALVLPAREAEGLLWQRLTKAAEKAQRGEDSVRRARELLAENPSAYGHLAEHIARVEAQNEAERQAEIDAALKAYDASTGELLRGIYGRPGAAAPPSGEEARRALRGEASAESSFFSRLFSWRSSSVLDWAGDPPRTRLAAYDHEAALYDALAVAHADDPGAAAEFERRAALTREMRDQDRSLVLGEGQPARAEPSGPPDRLVGGFLSELEELERATPGR